MFRKLNWSSGHLSGNSGGRGWKRQTESWGRRGVGASKVEVPRCGWPWGEIRADTRLPSGCIGRRTEQIQREKGSPEIRMINKDEKGIAAADVAGSL